MCAGGAFALFSLLNRQAGLGTGGRTAALDRTLTQYSTGPVRSGSGASPRAQRRGPGGQGAAQGQGQGLGEGARPRLSAASRSSARAQHDWRQRLIAVSGRNHQVPTPSGILQPTKRLTRERLYAFFLFLTMQINVQVQKSDRCVAGSVLSLLGAATCAACAPNTRS